LWKKLTFESETIDGYEKAASLKILGTEYAFWWPRKLITFHGYIEPLRINEDISIIFTDESTFMVFKPGERPHPRAPRERLEEEKLSASEFISRFFPDHVITDAKK